MKRLILFVLMCVFLSTSIGFSVNYNMELYLYNEYNDPISGAALIVTNSSGVVYTGITNSDGSVDIFSLVESLNNYTILFSHDEFSVSDTNSTLEENVNLTIRGEPNIGSHKLFVLESDDWLSYSFWETRDMETWQNLTDLGFIMAKWKNDTLETENDLEALFTVLEEHDAVISPGIITCIPDFDAIEVNGYTEYVCDDISDGVSSYLTENVDGRENILDKHNEGYRSGVWYPIYHGRTHTNTDEWLEALQDGDTDAIQGFENKVIRTNSSYQLKSEYNRQDGMVDQFSYAKQNASVVEGMQQFENLFGFVPRTHAAAPNYRGDLTTLEVLVDNGFIGIRSNIGYYNSTSSSRITVEISDMTQNYSISVLDSGDERMDRTDWQVGESYSSVELAKVKVNSTFEAGDAVVDLTHRLNYVSEIFGIDWRDTHIEMLDEFLDWMAIEHPTTQYLTSYELHQIQKYGYSVQPWYNKTIVRNYLQVSKIITLTSYDIPTDQTSWGSIIVVYDQNAGTYTQVSDVSIINVSENKTYVLYDAFSNGISCLDNNECISGICGSGICQAVPLTLLPLDTLYQCNDRIDNDGDGKVDMADKGCVNRNDNDESDVPENQEDKKQEKKELIGDQKEEKKEEKTNVVKGEEVVLDVSDVEGVQSVSIVPDGNYESVGLNVEVYSGDQVPTAFAVGGEQLSGYDVYKYLDVDAKIGIESAVIRFEVDSEWLGERDKNSVILLHDTESGWEELETIYLSGEDTLVFEAETGSFSVFAVGVKTAGIGFEWLLISGAAILGGLFLVKRK